MKKPIVILGAYPPPIGGNAIHVQRLSFACRSRGLDCHVVDMYGRSAADTPKWVYRPSGGNMRRLIAVASWLSQRDWGVAHFHVSSMGKFVFAGWPLLLATRRSRHRFITIHSGSFVGEMQSRSGVYRMLVTRLLDGFSLVITVNQQQKDFLCNDMGLDPRRVRVIPAFIPPTLESSDKLLERVSSVIRGARLIVGSGYAKPIYGHHLLLESTRRLQAGRTDVGLVMALYSEYDQGYFRQLEEAAKAVDRCVITKDLSPAQFYALLSRADIYARTSFTDGDAISVREALYNRCTVVASDCVPRPQGVLLFRTGSVESLCDSLQRALSLEAGVHTSTSIDKRDYSEDIIDLYEEYGLV